MSSAAARPTPGTPNRPNGPVDLYAKRTAIYQREINGRFQRLRARPSPCRLARPCACQRPS